MLENLSKRLAPYGHLPRRAMAAALALVLCLGMLPMSALAVESAATPTEAITMDPTDIAGAMGEGDEAKWGASADNLSNSGTLVDAVTAANAASSTTYIQLQKDVNTSNYLSFASGKTTVLDLGGKIINRRLTSSQAYGYVVKVAGDLTINDSSNPSAGKITGGNNNASSGGGVYVYNGSCTLTGGSISGNTATGGGGVSVYNGSFTMSGGSITGNTSSGTGGGVSVRNSSTFHVSGAANISGNTSGGTASNVYLPDNTTITVTGTLTGTIGVSTKTAPTQGASVDVAVGKTDEPAYTIQSTDAEQFVSDSESYLTTLSEGKVVLSNVAAIAPQAEWTVGGETKTGTFAEALEAMKTSGGSIKLLTDVSTAAATTLPTKIIFLDLNGKTWTSSDRTQIPSSGTLNLADTGTGGKILSTGPSFTVETGGTLNLSGGTIENNSGASYPALSNSGTVTMSGGKIARSGCDIKAVDNYYSSSFTMTDGEITNDAGDGIENSNALTITGGSITARGSGVLNNNMNAIATITGGSVTSTNGYGISNRSGTLYLGGTASVTATVQSALYTMANLYLSGTPTLTKGTGTYAYQIYGDDDTIVASNGKTDGELAYYTGATLEIYVRSSFPADKALVSGIKDEEQSEKFNIIIGIGNMMKPVYDDTAKTISAKAKIYNITYKDRAKVTGGANFSGTHGTDAPTTYTAGIKTTLVDPTKAGCTFGGWYERAWGSTDNAVTALKENPYGDKTFYAKWIPDTLTEKTDTPNLTRTIDAASWEGKVYFGLQAGSEYQEHVVYKLYTTADGNDMPDGITVKDEWGDSIKISSITTSTDYWLTATEDGKTESERVKISARAQYTGLDESGNLAITTPQQLADYLNYCEPGAATVSDTTVTLAKDVPLLYDIYFADDFGGALDLHGFTVTVYDEAAFRFYSPDAENVKFTLKGGGKVAAEDGLYAIAQEAGGVAIENATLIGGSVAILSAGGTLSLTDVTVKVPQTEVDDSATLYIAPDVKFTIHSGTFTNGNVDGYTYYGPPGASTPAKTLASCIASGSTSVPTDSMATGTKYQICKDTITVTKGGGGQPIPPDGILSAPLSQDEVDSAFGPGNATFVSPDTITINKDLVLEDSIQIDTSVTIDLDGKNVTVKDSGGNENGKPAFIVTDDATLTVTGPGSITGGKGSGTGAGGSGIGGTGNGSVVIGGGASVVGGSGGGTNGSGGDGVKTENGNITVGTGSVTGGSGSGSGTGGNGSETTGTGDITIGGGGSSAGGIGGNGNGSTSGGTGGTGTSTGNTGDTTVDGSVSGGNGGNGANNGAGNGGNGGNGANENDTITGGGTITGGNGGNIPDGGTGTPGSGGGAITGGGNSDGFTGTTADGKGGINANAQVEVKPGAPAVTVPEQDLINGAVTDAERNDNSITKIDVTLKVEQKPNPTDKDDIDNAVTPGQEIGIYLDIVLEKILTKSSGTTTETVTNTNAPIRITITIPEGLRGGSSYKIIRAHSGPPPTTTTITPTYDAVNHTLTFETDLFSTYAIAYTPANPVTPPTPPYDGGGDSGSTSNAPAPIIIKPDGGTVTLNPTRPRPGQAVTVTPKPDEGYVVDKVIVTDQNGKDVPVKDNGDGTYSYTQPKIGVTVTVTFKPAEVRLPWNPFTDVAESDWFYESVKYVYEQGLVNGTASDKFSPEQDTSRGMIVTILWRLEGEKAAKGTNPFADVSADAYYAKAVAWATENGIVKGYGNGNFGPNDPITREQLASILYRYAQLKGMDIAAKGDLTKFIDQPSTWAAESVRWAVGAGIISGKSNGILDPKGEATRAETASMLERFLT